MKKQVIAYVHFHWDREWYREFEIFRMRLLRAFDNVLKMLKNETLPYFYFDGQTSALLDYLEIRPEKRELVKYFIKEKRLFIGPFYCLVDEFLAASKSFKKNLEIGLKHCEEFCCEDFVGYFADTFGHSASVIPILNEFGIDKAVVWRGCGNIPSEFMWKYDNSQVKTVNLIRGYFNDVFSLPYDIHKKSEILKSNLDKISEKSGNILLLPIGADHLGVEKDITEQISSVNELLEDYEIKIGTLFEYFDKTVERFKNYTVEGELRDNSTTFILEGCYSSRPDIKKYNILSEYKLDLADECQKYFGGEYKNLIDYAYKLLVQNQAHDSICGCSTDDVHYENILRYKKILQIANNIISEIIFYNKSNANKILNLAAESYTGVIEYKSVQKLPYQVIKIEKGFSEELLCDTQKIPITEDYIDIYTYVIPVKNVPAGLSDLIPDNEKSDIFITENQIGNSKIFLRIKDGKIFAGENELKFVDCDDSGDSYNSAPEGAEKEGAVLSSKVLLKGETRSILWLEIDLGDILNIEVSVDKFSPFLNFKIEWENTKKNHLLQAVFNTKEPASTVYSEDMGNIIRRSFDCAYNKKEHYVKTKGFEVKSNNAPVGHGVFANGLGIITKGITQYEVFKNELRLPLLRSSGIISDPYNPARTTPAGPPIAVNDLQMLKKYTVEYSIYSGEADDLKRNISAVYNKCLILHK